MKEQKYVEPKIEYGDPEIVEPIRADNIFGMFQAISVIPTVTPKSFADQIQIYTSGATYRVYVYDVINNTWRYATLT